MRRGPTVCCSRACRHSAFAALGAHAGCDGCVCVVVGGGVRKLGRFFRFSPVNSLLNSNKFSAVLTSHDWGSNTIDLAGFGGWGQWSVPMD